MPIALTKVPVRLISAARDRNLVPLVGTGVSMQADTSWGKAIPNMDGDAVRSLN